MVTNQTISTDYEIAPIVNSTSTKGSIPSLGLAFGGVVTCSNEDRQQYGSGSTFTVPSTFPAHISEFNKTAVIA